MPVDLLIHNANETVCFDEGRIKILLSTSIACEKNQIVWMGSKLPESLSLTESTKIIDATGKVVLPGLIDSHTHSVFAGSREGEFEQKLEGATYLEIAEKGGGIKSTMRATRTASKEELVAIGKRRMSRALAMGITTVEIKSGYGLSTNDEMKMLEAIDALRQESDVRVISTFLGAHTVPPEYSGRSGDYISLICEEMLPAVAERNLAQYCDAFCEKGAFSLEETRRLFFAAQKYGLKLKLHADQLTNSKGAELCAEMGAVSADHLESISEEGIKALGRSGKTVAGLLPGCSFFLRMQYPPARRLIDAGVPVALATDFNPGSCMTQNLPMIMSIACTQMRMTTAEVIQAVTLNAAKALNRRDIGNLAPGLTADIAIFDVPSFRYIPYHFAQNHVSIVIKSGKVVVS